MHTFLQEKRLVMFDTASLGMHGADRRYLQALRSILAGAGKWNHTHVLQCSDL